MARKNLFTLNFNVSSAENKKTKSFFAIFTISKKAQLSPFFIVPPIFGS